MLTDGKHVRSWSGTITGTKDRFVLLTKGGPVDELSGDEQLQQLPKNRT